MRHWYSSVCMGGVWSADKTPPIQIDEYQCRIDIVIFSWWWTSECPKHVEKRNKYIKQNCAPSWTYLRNYTRMHGQQHIKCPPTFIEWVWVPWHMEGPHLLKDVNVLTPLLAIFLSKLGVIRNRRSVQDAAEHLWVTWKSARRMPYSSYWRTQHYIYADTMKLDGVLKV